MLTVFPKGSEIIISDLPFRSRSVRKEAVSLSTYMFCAHPPQVGIRKKSTNLRDEFTLTSFHLTLIFSYLLRRITAEKMQ